MENPADQVSSSDLISLSVELVSAYVTNNNVTPDDFPKLLAAIHGVLRGMDTNADKPPVEEKLVPAVPIKKSVTPDAIFSLEDGKPYKSLKRHLQAKHGLTPEQYRQKWSLPRDYPMVAPNYAAARSELAKATGLGQLRAAAARASSTVTQSPRPVPTTAPEQAEPKKRMGRPPKAASVEPAVQPQGVVKKERAASRSTKTPATAAQTKRARRMPATK